MQMNSEILRKIKSKLRSLLKDEEVLDVILFGSVVKGKSVPRDIDIALITDKNGPIRIQGFHVSVISAKEFLTKFPTLTSTLLQEGYSLKNNKFLAELFRFQNKSLYSYSLTEKNSSQKVRIVNMLRGKNSEEGLVKKYKGNWVANQVFILPIESTYIIDGFLIENKIKFKKHNLLIN